MLQPLNHLRCLLQSISGPAADAQTVLEKERKEGEHAQGEQKWVTQMASTHCFSTINEITEVCSYTSRLLCGLKLLL